MKSVSLLRLLLSLGLFLGLACSALAQQWRDAPAYDKRLAANVLERSNFYLPNFGSVYQAKFEALVGQVPGLRGIVIHNHGCGGQWGWETSVAQFYYREGFAVVTPEFVTRAGNLTGCPGGTAEESMRGGAERFREGLYTARNPARLSARGDDIQAVLEWLRPLSALPVFLSGHSEGCRTVYFWNRQDPQVRGGICHKQSLSRDYEHLWKWDTRLPMWSSNEDRDPWAQGSAATPAVGFERKFTQHPDNLTSYRVAGGDNHNPLVTPKEVQSLREWLNRQVEGGGGPRSTQGWVYEKALPLVQKRLSAGPKPGN